MTELDGSIQEIRSLYPEDFVWGAATAAFQIEGAADRDGRGESIWDRFCRVPGAVAGGDTGDIACDHYRLWESDLDLLSDMNVRSYRFSVAWPRIFPRGKGAVNPQGLDFYGRLIDGLLERGIRPAVTLYHWDLPQALQDEGGWTNRDTCGRFADYADTLFRAFSDRVPSWITINEPWVAAFVGHWHGTHAPGIRDYPAALSAAHHLLLAHGRAVEAFRSAAVPGEVGITCDMASFYPHSDSPEDRAAALRERQFRVDWYTRPVLKGSYPAELLDWYGERDLRPPVREGDMALIGQPVDFLGINYYTSQDLVRGKDWPLETRVVPTGRSVTEMDWEIRPEGLTDLLLFLKEEYPGTSLYVTENGAAYSDGPDEKGRVADARRTDYLRAHFLAAGRAIAQGAPLKGYYVWSLMDNFEWAFGYSRRFGLIHVDYPSQKRTPKDSALWCARVFDPA